MDLDALVQFFGRLHPVLVHFPIALVLCAVIFECCAVVRRLFAKSSASVPSLSPSAIPCLTIGWVGAAAAAWAGWVWAAQEPPGSSLDQDLFLHRWLGVGAAALAFIAWCLALVARRRASLVNPYRIGLVVTAGVVGLTSHLGGDMVHGEGFLLQPLRAVFGLQSEVEPTQESSAPDFDPETVEAVAVKAVLDARCIECHGPKKQKGNLRVDSLAALANAVVVTPGDPDSSELYLRVLLPEDDPDFMPAKNPPLSDGEADAIRVWIVSLGGGDAQAMPANARMALDRASQPAWTAEVEGCVAGLVAAGAYAQRLAEDSPFVQVNLSVMGGMCDDDTLAMLRPIAANIVELNLSGTKVTDDGLQVLANMGSLERLDISRTDVLDIGGAIVGLAHLKTLVAHTTRLNDDSLGTAAAAPGLRVVYAWNSSVTQSGASAVQAAHSTLRVDLGLLPAGVTTDARVETTQEPKRPACCEAAEAAGHVCDHPCCVEARGRGEVCAKCLGQ